MVCAGVVQVHHGCSAPTFWISYCSKYIDIDYFYIITRRVRESFVAVIGSEDYPIWHIEPNWIPWHGITIKMLVKYIRIPHGARLPLNGLTETCQLIDTIVVLRRVTDATRKLADFLRRRPNEVKEYRRWVDKNETKEIRNTREEKIESVKIRINQSTFQRIRDCRERSRRIIDWMSMKGIRHQVWS